MRRVSVIGGSSTGKTTVSRELARRLGVPHIELDALHHDPGWQEASADVLQARVEEALAAAPDGWVVDGNYFGKLGPLVLDQADTVVWLDVPYATTVRRVLRRTLGRIISGEELWNGNRESLRLALSRESIILWVLRTHRGFGAKWAPRLEGRNVVRVPDADAWLRGIGETVAVPQGRAGSVATQRPRSRR